MELFGLKSGNKRKAFILWSLIVLILAGVSSLSVWKKHQTLFPKIDENLTVTDGLGVSIHLGVTEKDIQLIADSGVKWARIDILWSQVETNKGEYDFKNTGYDELNGLLNKYHIRPYYILDYSNQLYEQKKSIVTEQGRDAFGKYVKVTVERYKDQGAIWEIWNEPNHPRLWDPQPNYEEYALLVKEVSPIIRKYDRSGTIVAPALASINEDALDWLQKVLEQGILNYIDVISVHPYQSNNPENVMKEYDELKKLIGRYTDKDIPIVSGEWGYSMAHTPVQKPITEMQHAEYLTRSFLINAKEGIPISIWYDWKNDGTDINNREHNFGIVSYYSNPKIAYLSLQTLTKQLEGYRFSKELSLFSNPNDYVLEFVNEDNKKIIVFWTSESSHNIEFSLKTGEGQIISMLGAVQHAEWKDKINVNSSSSPSYLVIE